MQTDSKKLSPEELEQCKVAGELKETDRLKLLLLNRNVDFFNSQAELFQLRALESTRALMSFSNALAERYDFTDPRQIEVSTGKIERDVQKLTAMFGSSDDAQR